MRRAASHVLIGLLLATAASGFLIATAEPAAACMPDIQPGEPIGFLQVEHVKHWEDEWAQHSISHGRLAWGEIPDAVEHDNYILTHEETEHDCFAEYAGEPGERSMVMFWRDGHTSEESHPFVVETATAQFGEPRKVGPSTIAVITNQLESVGRTTRLVAAGAVAALALIGLVLSRKVRQHRTGYTLEPSGL